MSLKKTTAKLKKTPENQEITTEAFVNIHSIS